MGTPSVKKTYDCTEGCDYENMESEAILHNEPGKEPFRILTIRAKEIRQEGIIPVIKGSGNTKRVLFSTTAKSKEGEDEVSFIGFVTFNKDTRISGGCTLKFRLSIDIEEPEVSDGTGDSGTQEATAGDAGGERV